MVESLLRGVEKKILARENKDQWKLWYGPVMFAFFIIVTAATVLIPETVIQVTVGSLCGVGIFISGYIIWYTNLPVKYNIMLDVRGNYPVLIRRRIALVVVLSWFVAIIVFHNVIPQPVAGAFTVAIILTCWHLGTASEEERAYLNELGEEWLEAEKARKAAKKEAKRNKKGLFSKPDDNDWDDDDDDWDDDDDDDWDDTPQRRRKN